MVNKSKLKQVYSIELLEGNAQYFNHYTDMIRCGHPLNVVLEMRKASEYAESDLDPYTYEQILESAKQFNERIVFDNGDYLLTANDTIIVLYQYGDIDVYGFDGEKLKTGDKVVWLDPDDNARDLRRVWTIDDIFNYELIKISEGKSEAEVPPEELVKANNIIHVDIISINQLKQ